jgi:hypothetical protein
MGSFLHASAIGLVRWALKELIVEIGGGGEREGNYFASQEPAYSEVCGCIGLHEILVITNFKNKICTGNLLQNICFYICWYSVNVFHHDY